MKRGLCQAAPIGHGRGVTVERYVGLDVSLKETHFCAVDAAGVELSRGREATHPELLVAALARHAPSARVVVLETGGQSS